MPGISSAIGWIAVAKQSAKGTPASAPTMKYKLAAAPTLMPVKERGRYVSTDTGPDQGPSFTSRLGVSGDFQIYMEPSGMALLWFLHLGANADSGTNPNFIHTATPADDLPYCTIWRMVGNVIKERYVDCKIGRLAIEGSAGAPFTVTLGVEGISATWNETGADALAALELAGYLFPELNGAVLFNSVAQRIHRLSFESNRNISPYQADDYLSADIDPGKREVNLSVGLRFQGATAFPDYKTFFYSTGTTLSPVVGTVPVDITITRTANLSQRLTFPQVTYAGVPVQPDPGGDPIEIDLSMNVEKSPSQPVLTVVSRDANTTV